METVTSEQQALIDIIRNLFGNAPFDTTSVAGKTYDHPELVTAIEAALPGRQWWKNSHSALRRLLTQLAKQHFASDQYGWWRIVETEATGEPDGRQSGQILDHQPG